MKISENDLILKIIARGASPAQAFGMVGNFIQESGLDPSINEINPVVPGSRGGLGLAQETGPRRIALEAFARDHGLDPNSADTQLDFIFNVEFPTTERRAARSFFAAKTPEEAALAFSRDFLRPGTPNNDRRVSEAQRLAQQFNGVGGTVAGADQTMAQDQSTPAEDNAFEALTLDPNDFKTQTNGLAGMLSPGQLQVLQGSNFLTRRIGNA